MLSAAYVCIAIPGFVNTTHFVICIRWPEDEKYKEYQDHVLSSVARISDAHSLFNQLLYLLLWPILTLSTFHMYVCILRTMMIRAENRQLNVSHGFENQLRQVGVMVIANGTIFFLCCSILFMNQMTTVLAFFEIQIFNESNYNAWLQFVHLTVGVNSSVNPVIYFITNKRYRKAFCSVFSIDCGDAVQSTRQKEYDPRPREVVSTL